MLDDVRPITMIPEGYVYTYSMRPRYRCGYSYKDQGQERVLALRMTHRHFQDLLANACLSSHVSEATQPNQTRVQWDPERGPRLEKLTYRSIQIGIPASRCKQWVDGEIESIEDVTHRARELKVAVETEPRTEIEDLVRLGLVPLETEYALPEALAQHLGMTE